MNWLIYQIFGSKVPRHIDREYHQILTHYSEYYQRLATDVQGHFRRRLFILLNKLAFQGGHKQTITREVRVVIGGAIIQITFGLDKYLPQLFQKVIVLPHRYMYPGYGQPFLGHTDAKARTVYFSWSDVRHGYLVPNDAVNVALHEMAHVLEHEHVYQNLFKRFFKRIDWKQWAKLAFDKMHRIRAKQHDFLKSYGGINMSEMFAVCVETFFEQPKEFKTHLPELYQTLVNLLRQDPLKAGDPRIGGMQEYGNVGIQEGM